MMSINYYDKEHVTALLEEGYSESDIAHVMEHSIEWVREARAYKRPEER